MASIDGGDSNEEVSDASKYPALSMPLSPPSIGVDDAEEWEYEYSTTETEVSFISLASEPLKLTTLLQTYYLTLDLTNPSVPCPRSKDPKSGRGSYKSTWINPSLGRHKRQLGRAPIYSIRKGGSKGPISTPTPTPAPHPYSESVDPEEPEAPEEEDDMQNTIDSFNVDTMEAIADKELAETETEDRPDEIQILDLHSNNPLVSWRGHNFSCSWAENLGTELLFAFHDPAKPVPILRALKDDVDLLAASSARLISTPVTLTPKQQLNSGQHGNHKASRREPEEFLKGKREGFMIPVGRDAREPRKEQASFLERLTEIKKRKGEVDDVTITAQRRLYPAGWRLLVKEKRDKERRELQSAIVRGGEEGRVALTRLKEMDTEDAAVEEERLRREGQVGKKKKPGRKLKEDGGDLPQRTQRGGVVLRRPRGLRGRKRESADLSFLNVPSGGARHGPQRVLSQGMLSTPTPQRWDEVEDAGSLEQPDDDCLSET